MKNNSVPRKGIDPTYRCFPYLSIVWPGAGYSLVHSVLPTWKALMGWAFVQSKEIKAGEALRIYVALSKCSVNDSYSSC